MTGPRRTAVQRTAGIRLFVAALRGLLLVALSAGYLVPALHFTLIQHEICAEHGALEHRGALAAHAEHGARSQDVALHAVPSVEHEHEHCAVCATSSQGAVTAARSAAAVTPAAHAAVSSVSPDEHAHPGLELLAYAPKLAPPA